MTRNSASGTLPAAAALLMHVTLTPRRLEVHQTVEMNWQDGNTFN
jgi:hypothetical protein